MDAAVREAVRRRAHNRCEYCRLPQSAVPEASFHVEHVRAKQYGGTDEEANLALACDRCNLYKGPNLTAIDPVTGNLITLFHPRTELWSTHFGQRGSQIVGRTPTGRATVHLLNMNAPRRVQLRATLRGTNAPH